VHVCASVGASTSTRAHTLQYAHICPHLSGQEVILTLCCRTAGLGTPHRPGLFSMLQSMSQPEMCGEELCLACRAAGRYLPYRRHIVLMTPLSAAAVSKAALPYLKAATYRQLCPPQRHAVNTGAYTCAWLPATHCGSGSEPERRGRRAMAGLGVVVQHCRFSGRGLELQVA